MTLNVLVSVGTHEQAFQRLLDAVAPIVDSELPVQWTVQYGVGNWNERDGVRSLPYLTYEEMQSALSSADILISQASPGNIFGALEQNTWPIVIGRSFEYGEHVDDHQLRFAKHAEDLGLATEVESVSQLRSKFELFMQLDQIELQRRCMTALGDSGARSTRFRSDFWEHAQSLITTEKKRSREG